MPEPHSAPRESSQSKDSSTPPAPSNVGPERPGIAWRCRSALILFFGVALALLAADQITKVLTFRYVPDQPVQVDPQGVEHRLAIPPHQPIIVAPKVLALYLTANTGAVFGVGKGHRAFFIIVSIVATLVILRVFAMSPPHARATHLALAMILSGALGNMIDRVLYEAVRDMFWLFPDVHLPWGWSWPDGKTDLYPWIFNVADVALIAGVVLMFVTMWFVPQPRPAEP